MSYHPRDYELEREQLAEQARAARALGWHRFWMLTKVVGLVVVGLTILGIGIVSVYGANIGSFIIVFGLAGTGLLIGAFQMVSKELIPTLSRRTIDKEDAWTFGVASFALILIGVLALVFVVAAAIGVYVP